MDLLITLGYYISSIGFLIATIMSYKAFKATSQSGLRTVLKYIFIGTGTFFAVTIFQKLGADFFGIEDTSVDIWWHLMFYLAMISYYIAFKNLSKLGSESDTSVKGDNAKTWGIIVVILLVIFFIIPHMTDSWIQAYTNSKLGMLGLHHFIAFIMAGIVGAYIFSAKLFLGQIGKAIAAPMIIAIWALSLQHLWELLNESWKVIVVTDTVGEGVEKIFLTIAAISVIYAITRLKVLSTPQTPASTSTPQASQI